MGDPRTSEVFSGRLHDKPSFASHMISRRKTHCITCGKSFMAVPPSNQCYFCREGIFMLVLDWRCRKCGVRGALDIFQGEQSVGSIGDLITSKLSEVILQHPQHPKDLVARLFHRLESRPA